MSISFKPIQCILEKRNKKLKELNLEIREVCICSLVEKRIAEDLKTLEPVLNSGSSSGDKTPILQSGDIFETFILKSSKNLQHTSKSYRVV